MCLIADGRVNMKLFSSIVALFALCFSTHAVLPVLLAQTPSEALLNTQKIQSIAEYVRSEMRFEQIPGLAVGVSNSSGLLYAAGYGEADLKLKSAVDPQTVFNSGSLAKQFVAAAIMMLAQDEKIALSDSVTKYLPDAPLSWRAVRIENLLSHTSGLGDYSTVALTSPGALFDFKRNFSETEFRKRLYTLPSMFAPGTDWVYCNTNYVLLGMIIEKVTGESWDRFLTEYIFRPLNMSSARMDGNRAPPSDHASGYVMQHSKLKPEEWTASIWNSIADGSLYLNVADLAKWNEALLTGKLLSRATIDRMWTVFPLNNGKPNPGSYGFGFFVRSLNGHRLIEHIGAWQGFHDYSAIYPDDGFAVAVLTNLAYPLSRPQDIGKVVAGIYQPTLRPPDILPIPDPMPERTKHLLHLLNSLVARTAKPQDFTPELWHGIWEDPRALNWFKTEGTISTFQLLSQDVAANGVKLRYRARTTLRIFTITFVLTSDGKISDISLASEE